MPEVYSVAVFSLLTGLGVGLYEVATATYTSEQNNVKNRSNAWILLQGTYFLGAIFSIAFAFGLTPGLHPGHWRVLVGISSVPVVFGLFIAFVILKETPRYMIVKG
jgi:MFS family permease